MVERKEAGVPQGHIEVGGRMTWLYLLKFTPCYIECLIYAWSFKRRLITKLIAQIEINLRDESIKSNYTHV